MSCIPTLNDLLKFLRLYKVFATIIFLQFNNVLQSQQAPMFSQNMYTYSILNPGSYAIQDDINVTGITRQQWKGFHDDANNNVAPQTYLFSATAPIEILNGGVSLNFMRDQLGFLKDVSVGIGYARKLKLWEGFLGIGVSANLLNRKIDFSKFNPIHENDPILSSKDEYSGLITDLSFGFFYKVPNLYYLGISVVNFMESKGSIYHSNTTAVPITDRTFYIIGGYEWIFPRNPMLKFNPSVLIKSNLANTQFSLSGIILYNNRFWGGVTYNIQTIDAFAILFGIKFNDLEFGYGYGLPLSSINQKGNHEMMLNYCLKLSKIKKKDLYRNTRFL